MSLTTAPDINEPDGTLRFPTPPDASRRQLAGVLAAALAAHLALLALVLWRQAPLPIPVPPSDAIAVEIVAPTALAQRMPPPAAPPEAAIAPSAPEPTPSRQAALPQAAARPARPAEPDMIHPIVMLSARRLAERSSRPARAALRTLDDDTRVEQLCGLEAMEQVHEWRRDFQPDRLVAYAMGEPRPIADGIEADGAAFRSHANWYRIRFRCELSPDRTRVAAFAFAVGDPVPRDQWDERGLPSVH